ncbi:MAG: TIGR03905 family TSCPD domain-containing protein [Clostridia bacterium]|nr:TIGR03905 family TSCPD domain-containing protein [Clostridia bacterium]
MEYRFTPQGVCSTQIIVEVEEGVIKRLTVENGCHGNLQGISKLVEGMKVEDVIKRLEGIDCRERGTSCPDQIAKGLKKLITII